MKSQTNPPLHLIETFVIYASCLNLVKTAQQTKQTQPSASRQIRQFENFFRQPLFLEIGKTKKLTNFGESVKLYYEEHVLQLLERRESFWSQSFLGHQERLIIAARSEILQIYIAKLQFSSAVELRASTGDAIRLLMKENKLGAAVLQENFESFNYTRKKLFQSSWYLIAPKSWRFDSKTPLEAITSLSEKPFASYDYHLNTINNTASKGKELSDLNIQFVAEDWRLLVDKARQQQCWSIVPSGFEKTEGTSSISLEGLLKNSAFYIYFRKDLTKNSDIQHLIKQLV